MHMGMDSNIKDFMRNYRFGFSLKGYTAFMLVMMPNIVWIIIPPAGDPIAGNSAPYPIFDVVANISRAIMIALLIILIPRGHKKKKSIKLYIGLAAFCLAGYYALWAGLYAGMGYPWMFIGMAVLPSIYFISAGLWLKNYIAIIPSLVFGITHIAITCSNFLG